MGLADPVTAVTFHFNVRDRMGHAAKVAQRAVGRGHRVTCVLHPDELGVLDERLWTFAPMAFVAHAKGVDPESVRERSPILLLTEWPESGDVLLNLSEQVPAHCDRYARVVEVVSPQEADRVQARARWRHYLALGVKPVAHDVTKPSE